MSLQGADELRNRLRAVIQLTGLKFISGSTLPARWQQATIQAARPHIPVDTGASRLSLRPGVATRKHVTVVGKYTLNFIDAGSKAHVEPRQYSKFTPTGRISKRKRGSGKTLKFEIGGQTMFRRKVNKPRIAARPFKRAAAIEGLKAISWDEAVVEAWNKAAA